MKKKLYVLLLVCGVLQLHALGKVYPQDTNINFELWNKGRFPINTLNVKINNKPFEIGPNQRVQKSVAPDEKVTIKFFLYKPTTLNLGNPEIGKYEINAPGKTKYFSFTTQKGLYPQTGPLKGILGKTESGLSLKNNIKQNNIEVIKAYDFAQVKKAVKNQ